MRSRMVTAFSTFLVGVGFVSIIWVASSLVGVARSQDSVPQQLEAPTIDIPPPTEGETAGEPNTQAPLVDEQMLTEEFAPDAATTEGYIYDPTGRRDPFQPVVEQTQQIIQPPNQKVQTIVSTDPLQAFDALEYKVVGILWDTKNPRAVIRDPSGKSYPIKKDTKLGRNNGFVTMIREGAVLVVEPAFGENGLQTAVTRVLLLAN